MATEDQWIRYPKTNVRIDKSSLSTVASEALASAEKYLQECLRDEERALRAYRTAQNIRKMAEDSYDYWKQAVEHANAFTAKDV